MTIRDALEGMGWKVVEAYWVKMENGKGIAIQGDKTWRADHAKAVGLAAKSHIESTIDVPTV